MKTLRVCVVGMACGAALWLVGCDTAHPPAAEPPTPAQEQANPSPPPEVPARNLVTALAAGDWAGATMDFDRTFQEKMTPQQLQDFWIGLTAGKGNFTRISDVTMSKQNENDLAIVTCGFEQGEAVIQVTIDPAGKITGVVLR